MAQTPPNSQMVKTEPAFWQLQRVFNIYQAVNGGIDFGVSTQVNIPPGGNQYTGNINGQWANVTAPVAPNTEFAVPHKLGRIPSFYLYICDRSANLYQLPNTGTAWTATNIYLKCDTASAVLRIFIT
jgi:hypothetical protein